ncbi:hypothetical protein AAMO2058_000168900, partial [Amorphochlora amoebiformis]
EHINFSRSVADSYLLIERLVIRRLPYLRCSRDRTIQDYILKVAKEFQLDDFNLASYVVLYEHARFGNVQKAGGKAGDIGVIKAKMFLQFIRCLIQIVDKIRVGYRTQSRKNPTYQKEHKHLSRSVADSYLASGQLRSKSPKHRKSLTHTIVLTNPSRRANRE